MVVLVVVVAAVVVVVVVVVVFKKIIELSGHFRQKSATIRLLFPCKWMKLSAWLSLRACDWFVTLGQ